MIWYVISRYIATYHTMSHRITQKDQANTNSTKTHHFFAVYELIAGKCVKFHLWAMKRHKLPFSTPKKST